MSWAGYTDYVPSATTLASDAVKSQVTESLTYTLMHTLTSDATSEEYFIITQVSMGLNANTILGVSLQGGYSTQIQDASESSITDIGTSISEGGASSDCTNDTGYSTRTLSTSPLPFTGLWGKDVTVRFYMKTDDTTNTTAMCSKNATVTGKRVKRVSQLWGGTFRGAF